MTEVENMHNTLALLLEGLLIEQVTHNLLLMDSFINLNPMKRLTLFMEEKLTGIED